MLNRNFTPFPILTTERLTLRQLVIADDQEIFRLRSDREINKYLNRQLCPAIDEAREFINKVNENWSEQVSLYWAITLLDSNRLVGTICLFDFSEEQSKCEIGYELFTPYQGQGIMKEAAEKVIDYAFHTIKVQKIEAYLHSDNQNSIKLLEKCSFRTDSVTDRANPGLISYQLTHA